MSASFQAHGYNWNIPGCQFVYIFIRIPQVPPSKVLRGIFLQGLDLFLRDNEY